MLMRGIHFLEMGTGEINNHFLGASFDQIHFLELVLFLHIKVRDEFKCGRFLEVSSNYANLRAGSSIGAQS